MCPDNRDHLFAELLFACSVELGQFMKLLFEKPLVQIAWLWYAKAL